MSRKPGQTMYTLDEATGMGRRLVEMRDWWKAKNKGSNTGFAKALGFTKTSGVGKASAVTPYLQGFTRLSPKKLRLMGEAGLNSKYYVEGKGRIGISSTDPSDEDLFLDGLITDQESTGTYADMSQKERDAVHDRMRDRTRRLDSILDNPSA